MIRSIAAIAAITLALPAFADGHASGDAEAGKKTFNKCKSCHMIAENDDNVIVKGGKTGPNLYGVIGRQAGVQEGFKYGDDLVAAGEAGLVWNEENLVEYIADPRKFLQATLDDKKAKSRMSYKLKKGGEDVVAYLKEVGPEVTEEAEASDS